MELSYKNFNLYDFSIVLDASLTTLIKNIELFY